MALEGTIRLLCWMGMIKSDSVSASTAKAARGIALAWCNAGRGLLFRSDSRLTSHQLGSLGKIVLQLSVTTTG